MPPDTELILLQQWDDSSSILLVAVLIVIWPPFVGCVTAIAFCFKTIPYIKETSDDCSFFSFIGNFLFYTFVCLGIFGGYFYTHEYESILDLVKINVIMTLLPLSGIATMMSPIIFPILKAPIIQKIIARRLGAKDKDLEGFKGIDLSRILAESKPDHSAENFNNQLLISEISEMLKNGIIDEKTASELIRKMLIESATKTEEKASENGDSDNS